MVFPVNYIKHAECLLSWLDFIKALFFLSGYSFFPDSEGFGKGFAF
jgi:hypothetical protein